ncbi:MAG: two-component system phosphate regulon response regulator PhoB [Candidatus Midichloriaceae bacterium]|jgi:two-component system phosphate regulon response regulator PhoB
MKTDINFMPKILLIEDDESVYKTLIPDLKDANYNVELMTDGLSVLDSIHLSKPDLVILDWLLPGKSGIELCHGIKKQHEIPIIMISSRGSDFEKILGLDTGADDYLTKPFSNSELFARIRALLRRVNPLFNKENLVYKNIRIDVSEYKAYVDNKELKISPIEFKLLIVLLENPEKIIPRDVIMNKVWGSKSYVFERTVDVHIARLRKAFSRAFFDNEVDPIKTIRSIGFKIEI